jgi:hypothetical protein
MRAWLKSLDENAVTYRIGLVMLFAGLAISVSVATALIIVGGAMAAESVITSYVLVWIGGKK